MRPISRLFSRTCKIAPKAFPMINSYQMRLIKPITMKLNHCFSTHVQGQNIVKSTYEG